MWLAYLRFDSEQGTRIAFVRCASKAVYEEVLGAAKSFREWELTEYVMFQARNTIHSRVVPNFSEELIFESDDFLRKCGVTPGTRGSRPPSSSAGRGRKALPGNLSLGSRPLELPE